MNDNPAGPGREAATAALPAADEADGPQTTLGRGLPENLQPLDEISRNFYWSWKLGGSSLFRDLDPELWDRCEQNPRELLSRVSDLRLWQRSADTGYLERLTSFHREFKDHISQPPGAFGRISAAAPVAYFCAEFGIHNSLPIYSGGLGILAGDHLKSASDLNIPLIAVGLFYRFGYFRQHIGHDGWQVEHYSDTARMHMALQPVLDEAGEEVRISVRIRSRDVAARTWLVGAGRVSLYLLDTNVPENIEVDRLITGHLYGGDIQTRIVQEAILGIGGVRLIRKLGIEPSVFHLNEGHSAFLTLEIARELLESGASSSFAEAAAEARRQCVFTTHTPVSAGNDTFPLNDVRNCIDSGFIEDLKLTEDEFFGLGRVDSTNADEPFGMTPLALRMCRSANGVSRKHGEVSRELWRGMFGAADGRDVPITYVTNGVHPPTWVAPVFQDIFAEGPRGVDPEQWAAAVRAVPDEDIWKAHLYLKHLLIAFISERTCAKDVGATDTINERSAVRSPFSAETLTIGFARRVAGYKRWDLILTDTDRLLRIVDDAERPVQFVFAGKAHPQDLGAKEILQKLMSINHDSNWQNRAAFIEDYDQEIARHLVHGVDVWMNVPRRPMEASGTSGMKAAMNGVLNLSVLDGWWIEGYNGTNGFAVGGTSEGGEHENSEDAESLYSLLENDVVPLFYDRGPDGIPHGWVARMKDAIATLTPQFSSDRMVADYLEKIYGSV
jgi:glycogen phosphorylase